MNCCKETDNAIRVIKGDVLEVYFVVDDVEVEYIERVIFSSISAKILCDLPYSEEQEAFCLRFTSKMSNLLPAGFYTYDLTLELKGGTTLTLMHGEEFTVFKKKNSLFVEDYLDEEQGNDKPEDGEGNETEEPIEPPADEGDEGDDNEGKGDDGDDNNKGGNDGDEKEPDTSGGDEPTPPTTDNGEENNGSD